jgi:uracil-DNA glycosylase family 4
MTVSFDEVDSLDALSLIAHGCTRCDLSRSRTNVVFGSGSPSADVMIVGEGPGRQEDEQGLPFVGRSGQLLEALLGEVGLARADVYIANVVKCRPPGNRDQRPDEIGACKGYLRRQIQLVDPTVVITLGNFSSKLLLRTETGITRLRGTVYEWWGRYLVPTFHPAAALRGGERVTNDIRADLALVRSVIDGRLPSATTTDITHHDADSIAPADDTGPQLDLFGGQP